MKSNEEYAIKYYNSRKIRIPVSEFTLKFGKSSNHFIERVKERYGIDIDLEQYIELCRKPIIKNGFLKSPSQLIGTMDIKGKKIFVLYSRHTKLLTTAYPPIIEHDMEQAIMAYFSRPQRMIISKIYVDIVEEINASLNVFENVKAAAIYYFKTSNYPILLIMKFRHGTITTLQVCREMKRIIEGQHERVSISIQKSMKHEN